MAEEREQWGSRTGFLLAAIGSAVGLGNIWRFPYVAYDNGGGAFLVPYLIALVTAGVPLLVLEYTLGHRFRGSAPAVFRRLHPKAEVIGWWQVAICIVIASYYAVLIAWAVRYIGFSFGQQWGADAEAFLFEGYLGAVDAGEVGGFRWGVAAPLIAVWALTLGVLVTGVKGGIERANRVLMPTLVVTFVILVIRAVTLEGAAEGVDALFRPDWSAMSGSGIWIAAYGQVFFSLSVGFAIMITYSSYLPKRSDLTNNATIAALSNTSFDLLAGVGVFAAVGFLAASSGVPVEEAATDGIGLAFIAFPALISELPGLNTLFGILFFSSLVFAGFTSLISIVEASVAAFREKLGWSRRRTVAIVGGGTAAVSLLYATGGGVNLLDTVDHFINSFGVAVVGLVEVVVVIWVVRRVRELRDHANRVSDLPLGGWWTVTLGGITPVFLSIVIADSVRLALVEPYEGYPLGFLAIFGWGSVLGVIVVALALSGLRWSRDPRELPLPQDSDTGSRAR